ncbi:Pyruvate/Phosphoenolpyruvate kinase-like domain-containing protein [Mycena vulgaris]|nr:Pyruvate/Phosphoenolpyruvate kinase-like domain-containing protein [Mycena vulgaris]
MPVRASPAKTKRPRSTIRRYAQPQRSPYALARAIASHPRAKAIASASYASVIICGSADDDLTLDDNLAAVRGIIAAGIRATPKKPEIIKLGAVGCNIEDFDRGKNALWSVDEGAARVALAKKVATRCGVPEFVVNARCDALFQGTDAVMDSVIRRSKAYLAGERLMGEFGGMLNRSMRLDEGFLKKDEIQALGVARVSIGPALYLKTLDAFSSGVDGILGL